MREIKFRAPRYKDSIYGVKEQKIVGWVTFNLQSWDADWNSGEPFILDCETKEEVASYLVDTTKSRQYTGLKDKSREDIYEGDILDYKSGHGRVTVKFGPQDYRGEWLYEGWNINEPTSDYKIIGNIYENPKLVKA